MQCVCTPVDGRATDDAATWRSACCFGRPFWFLEYRAGFRNARGVCGPDVQCRQLLSGVRGHGVGVRTLNVQKNGGACMDHHSLVLQHQNERMQTLTSQLAARQCPCRHELRLATVRLFGRVRSSVWHVCALQMHPRCPAEGTGGALCVRRLLKVSSTSETFTSKSAGIAREGGNERAWIWYHGAGPCRGLTRRLDTKEEHSQDRISNQQPGAWRCWAYKACGPVYSWVAMHRAMSACVMTTIPPDFLPSQPMRFNRQSESVHSHTVAQVLVCGSTGCLRPVAAAYKPLAFVKIKSARTFTTVADRFRRAGFWQPAAQGHLRTWPRKLACNVGACPVLQHEP